MGGACSMNGKMEMHTKFYKKNPKEREHLGY
jgi:hypothetical protein